MVNVLLALTGEGISLLILMRHGQSIWNAKNIFTGWVDVPLSPKGVDEAIEGGKSFSDIEIDEVHTSTLIRAQMTTMLALSSQKTGKSPVIQRNIDNSNSDNTWYKIHGEEGNESILPVYISDKLNERMYGDLQGHNKQKIREIHGDEQVKIWRRSFDISPPNGESLKDTAERTIPYFEKEILTSLVDGKNVFVSAHGNSLRSIVMYIEDLDQVDVLNLEIPTGVPILYKWSDKGIEKV